MASNAARAATLVRALQWAIEGGAQDVFELCTDDVKLWAPAISATSAKGLVAELERRDAAFSAFELDIAPLDVGGDYACAEWSVSMTHSDSLILADGKTIEPTGLRLAINGVAIAEFRGNRICWLRQYWDELSILEQLGVLPER